MKRTAITSLMVIVGLALMTVSYFALSAPLGRAVSPAFSDPRIPFAPGLFIIGLMATFLAAVVYELLPDKES